MAENRKGRDNRYYLTRGQMIILGGTFSVASVVVFLIGMLVGKTIEERKILKKEEPLVKMPVKPAGAAAKSDEITFYDTLSRSPQALAEQPSKELKEAEKKAAEKALPEKAARAEVKETKPAVKAEPAPVKAAEAKVEKAKAAADSKSGAAADAGEAKSWRVQVDAYPDERSAKRLVDRLKNKGYNAYVNEVQYRNKPWFRVNVGKFNSRDEADKAASALKNQENFAKVFVSSK